MIDINDKLDNMLTSRERDIEMSTFLPMQRWVSEVMHTFFH